MISRLPKETTGNIDVGHIGKYRETPLPQCQQEHLVSIARSWLGTKYHHQASVKGVGCDCLGFVRGVYREFYGQEPEQPPPYSRSWGEFDGRELMMEAAQRHLILVGAGRNVFLIPGDVIIFRIRRGSVAKHCAMYIGNNRMIHAFESAPVCEVELQRPWRLKIAAVFQFPLREDNK